MPIGGLLGSRPIQTLLAPGDAYHSTAAVLSAVDAIASTCAASIEISSVGTAGEWPLKLVKLRRRRAVEAARATFGMHGREYQSAEIGSPSSSSCGLNHRHRPCTRPWNRRRHFLYATHAVN